MYAVPAIIQRAVVWRLAGVVRVKRFFVGRASVGSVGLGLFVRWSVGWMVGWFFG